MGVYIRSLMAHCHKLIADRVFNTQRDEVQAGEWTTACAHFHLDGLRRREPVRPGQAIGRVVHIVFRQIGGLAHFPEHAAGNVTLEIDPIHAGPGSEEGDPAVCLRSHRYAKVVEFLFEHALQPTRAGCKEP